MGVLGFFRRPRERERESAVASATPDSSLREEIFDAMRQHGIDPETAAAEGRIDVGDQQALQAQIMETLHHAGVDAGDDVSATDAGGPVS